MTVQELGDVEAAKTCFMTALTLNPHHAKSLLMLGRLHRKGHQLYDDDLAQVPPPLLLSQAFPSVVHF